MPYKDTARRIKRKRYRYKVKRPVYKTKVLTIWRNSEIWTMAREILLNRRKKFINYKVKISPEGHGSDYAKYRSLFKNKDKMGE